MLVSGRYFLGRLNGTARGRLGAEISTEYRGSTIANEIISYLDVCQREGVSLQIGASDPFDHIIPFSKGGTSLKADNVQLLCARHNLEKRDRIE